MGPGFRSVTETANLLRSFEIASFKYPDTVDLASLPIRFLVNQLALAIENTNLNSAIIFRSFEV